MRFRTLVLLLALVIASGLPIVALADGPHDQEMREIAKILQCPVCQGQPVLDSAAPLASQMREVILEKLKAGESKETIIQYFVERYDEGILLDPPKRGFTLGVWLGPVFVVVIGLVLLSSALRGWLRRQPDASTDSHWSAGFSEAEIDHYDSRLREELAQKSPLGLVQERQQAPHSDQQQGVGDKTEEIHPNVG